MIKGLTMVALLLLLAAGCAGSSGGGNGGGENGGNAGSSAATSATQFETTGANATTGGTRVTSETTGEGTTGPSQIGDVQVEQLSSGAMGPEQRRILIATSAQDLAAATGIEIPDAGEGTYVAVAWGEKPTGGYTVGFEPASEEGVRVTVNVALEDPPPDAMVAQAITYPYAVAFLPGVDPGEQEFVFVTQNGREIGWPVRSV
jgi:hypothetical protein